MFQYLPNEQLEPDRTLCPDHPGRLENLYCADCEVVFCPLCLSNKHPKHSTMDLSVHMQKQISDLKPKVEECTELCKNVAEIWYELKQTFSSSGSDINLEKLENLVEYGSKKQFEDELKFIEHRLQKQLEKFTKTFDEAEFFRNSLNESVQKISQTLTYMRTKNDKNFDREAQIGQLDQNFKIEPLGNCLRLINLPNTQVIAETVIDLDGNLFCRSESRPKVSASFLTKLRFNNRYDIQLMDKRCWQTKCSRFLYQISENSQPILMNIALSNNNLYGLFYRSEPRIYSLSCLNKETLVVCRNVDLKHLPRFRDFLVSVIGCGEFLIVFERVHGFWTSMVILKNENYQEKIDLTAKRISSWDIKTANYSVFMLDEKKQLIVFNIQTREFKTQILSDLRNEPSDSFVVGTKDDRSLFFVGNSFENNGFGNRSLAQVYILQSAFETMQDGAEIQAMGNVFYLEPKISFHLMTNGWKILTSRKNEISETTVIQFFEAKKWNLNHFLNKT